MDQDIYLQDGDYIYVPPSGNLVEVVGAVNRPYTYESKKGETVDDLIKYSRFYKDGLQRYCNIKNYRL